jgi:hypothetical protein
MSMASAVSAWRWRRVLRALDRRWRRRLEADLAAYSTPRDRTDLTALLDRYELEHGADDTAVLRDILWSQQECAERRRRPAAGFAVTRSGW